MTTDAGNFAASYASALARYLRAPDQTALQAAHELGRRAVDRQLTVVDLARAHHASLETAVSAPSDVAACERIVRAAGEFYLASMSAFEMVLRDVAASRDLALVERRHAAMLRQLSNFLSDASLALSMSESVHEVLTLVVEQARELVGGGCALAAIRLRDEDPIVASSFTQTETTWAGLLEGVAASRLEPLLRPLDGTTTAVGEGIGDDPLCTALSCACGSPDHIRAWLAAPITTLDGRQLGSIHLVDDADDCFTELAGPVLAQVAQMASAAIERTLLYTERSRPPR